MMRLLRLSGDGRPNGLDLDPTEKIMTKLLALATALIVAISATFSTAQAGMRVGVGIGVGGLALGALGAMSNNGGSEAREYQPRKKARSARRDRDEAPARSSKKKSEKTEVAKEAPASEEPVAETAANETSSIAGAEGEAAPEVITGSAELADQPENSSIALTSVAEPVVKAEPAVKKAEAATPIETVSQAPKAADCKKFFPSVGMTLSVPCE